MKGIAVGYNRVPIEGDYFDPPPWCRSSPILIRYSIIPHHVFVVVYVDIEKWYVTLWLPVNSLLAFARVGVLYLSKK